MAAAGLERPCAVLRVWVPATSASAGVTEAPLDKTSASRPSSSAAGEGSGNEVSPGQISKLLLQGMQVGGVPAVPAGQPSQDVRDSDTTRPALQTRGPQSAGEMATALTGCVPGGQAKGRRRQKSRDDAPAAAVVVPSGQRLQVALLVCPVLLDQVPCGHASHGTVLGPSSSALSSALLVSPRDHPAATKMPCPGVTHESPEGEQVPSRAAATSAPDAGSYVAALRW